MISHQHIDLFFTCAGLCLLWWMYAWLYQSFRIDLMRDRLFDTRDRLFLIGASGAIPFNSPAYGYLRTLINGTIRHAHRFSVLGAFLQIRAIKASYSIKSINVAVENHWANSIEGLSPEAVADANKIRAEVHLLIMDHLFRTSLLLLPLLMIWKAIHLFKWFWPVLNLVCNNGCWVKVKSLIDVVSTDGNAAARDYSTHHATPCTA